MTAFDLGYEAFLEGKGDRENPYGYEFEPDNFDSWLNGWCAAADAEWEYQNRDPQDIVERD